jgi:hypothetical protein
MTDSFTNDNRPTNIWDERIWAYANIKAARDHGIIIASDLNDKAAEIIGLSVEQKNERAKNEKLRHIVTSEWSRTDLKNKGLIRNEGRGSGVWKLTSTGMKINCETYESFITEFKKITKTSMNYISQGTVDTAICGATFNENLKSGNATTHTSLIFQTLAFFAATTSKGGSIEIKARSLGRKLLSLEYTKLVARRINNTGEDGEYGYLSALGTKNRDSYQINTNKSASETLSSNFFTNINARKKYADFTYNEEEDKLTADPLLSEFKLSISELDPSGVKHLITLALRSVELPGERASAQDLQRVLIDKYGAAGEALWKALPDNETFESFSTSDQIAALGTSKPTTLISNLGLNPSNRLLCALTAKPFAILAGGTGTGKTKCAIELARKICQKRPIGEAADYEVVAVGADWTDTRPLLGYENILGATPSYTVPKALDLIIRASRNPERPFFLILDEMNLSHVERYFSDFLSIMESKKIDTEASTIKLHSNKDGMPSTDGNVGGNVEQRIQWPDNLFVIGTVNIDETTHMFSPKVLDRAHVIEFKPDESQITAGLKASWVKTAQSEADDELKKESEKGVWTDSLSGMLFKENRVMKLRKSVDIFNEKEDDKNAVEKRIMDAWRALSKTRFSFSHRTAQETADYIFISHRLLKENADVLGEPPGLNELVDLAFLQKILPKINGSAETLTIKADNKDPKAASKETTLLDVLISEFKKDTELTRCVQKLEEMKTTLEREHFVSFIQ